MGSQTKKQVYMTSSSLKLGLSLIIIAIGKASLSEWSQFRSFYVPNGWSGRCGHGKVRDWLLIRLLLQRIGLKLKELRPKASF